MICSHSLTNKSQTEAKKWNTKYHNSVMSYGMGVLIFWGVKTALNLRNSCTIFG